MYNVLDIIYFAPDYINSTQKNKQIKKINNYGLNYNKSNYKEILTRKEKFYKKNTIC
jgi:hypothetical protein